MSRRLEAVDDPEVANSLAGSIGQRPLPPQIQRIGGPRRSENAKVRPRLGHLGRCPFPWRATPSPLCSSSPAPAQPRPQQGRLEICADAGRIGKLRGGHQRRSGRDGDEGRRQPHHRRRPCARAARPPGFESRGGQAASRCAPLGWHPPTRRRFPATPMPPRPKGSGPTPVASGCAARPIGRRETPPTRTA